MAGMFAFSREHEARADRMGMRLMKRAGYDGHASVTVWENLLAELRITGGKEAGSRGDIFATHPTTTTTAAITSAIVSVVRCDVS